MKKLAILIPTLTDGAVVNTPGGQRIGSAALRNRVFQMFVEQSREYSETHEIQIFFNEDAGEKTTGAKRNELVAAAVLWGSDAHSFVDDDDEVGPTYIKRGIEFIESGLDCAELWGQIYWSGIPGKPFHHSITIDKWWEDDLYYYRTINHLNFVKTELVKDFKFPNQVFGEDGVWAMEVSKSGVLKTEFKIPEIIYHYYCGQPKHKI